MKQKIWKGKKIFAILCVIFLASSNFFEYSQAEMSSSNNLPFKKIRLSTGGGDKNDYVEGEVLVKYKPSAVNLKKASGVSKADSLEKDKNFVKISEFKNLNVRLLKSDKSTDRMIQNLKNNPSVDYVEPNFKRHLAVATNDTNFNLQWALNNTGQSIPNSNGIGSTAGTAGADINAPAAWDIENSSGSSVIVAVIDSGANYNHDDLASNMWDGSSCVDANNAAIPGGCPNHGWNYAINYPVGNNDPIDADITSPGHGTFVAGIIAANSNNSTGISGVSFYNHIKIMPIEFDFDIDSEIEAINFAKNNGAKVINASFGGSSFSQSEKDAIDSFPGIFVATAGNDGTNNDSTPYYPASCASSNIISVASTDQNDSLSSFSNYGAASVDVAAPGENIISTFYDQTAPTNTDYALGDGTSFAAPYVSGVTAMVISTFPSLSLADIKNQVINSGDSLASLSGKTVSGKRLNYQKAIQSIAPTPVYRFWSNSLQGHFYTSSADEKDSIIANYPTNIWNYEGVAYNAYANQADGTVPIYRFWSDDNGHHFYTASESEKDYVIANYPTNVWRYEGVAYYAFATQQLNTTSVYRFWSDTSLGHFYTASESEKDYVIANYPTNVWRYEGVAYYVPTD